MLAFGFGFEWFLVVVCVDKMKRSLAKAKQVIFVDPVNALPSELGGPRTRLGKCDTKIQHDSLVSC